MFYYIIISIEIIILNTINFTKKYKIIILKNITLIFIGIVVKTQSLKT
jgi:hypothetical protein